MWSPRAEPHWVAPAYLALAVHASRVDVLSMRLTKVALTYGGLCTLLVWASVSTPAFIKLASLPRIEQLFGPYRPKYDLSNDLYAWGPGRRLLSQAFQEATEANGQEPAVVGGPHWMICAQAQAALEHQARVGCATEIPSDFDGWSPRHVWLGKASLLFVSDSRYPVEPERMFPDRYLERSWHAQVERGGVVVRTITIQQLTYNRGLAADSPSLGGSGLRPAARTKSSSLSVSGLGVVSNWSP
jgi:hypothetical protein